MVWYTVAAVIGVLLFQYFWISYSQIETIPYSQFEQLLADGKVAEVTVGADSIAGTLKEPLPSGKREFFAVRVDPQLADKLAAQHVVVRGVPSGGIIQTILSWVIPAVIFYFVWTFLFRRVAERQGLGGLMTVGKSRAKVYVETDTKVTFKDVAGVDEAKFELQEVVSFLRDPKAYGRLGARIPKGILLVGPPGTGKTLLARAVAGEADVPFFSQAASEFVEAIVGIGASRVRDLFTKAKAAAPSIIFIDELDAIGRSRTSGVAGFSGGNDEREQTLNQILTEMDGFDSSTGVIVIAATNRPDVLDQALLRPGRFDRRVAVQPPDRNGREAILEVHTRSVPLASDVDLGGLAATTPGMVGADLANLVNEAALLAARRNHDKVREADFTDALEKIVLGAERKVLLSKEDKRRTAYHEGGHAIVGMLTPGADPVRKISIIPRGLALGVTFSAPEADRYNYSRDELLAKIKVSLGGRSAEEIVFGDLTTGAESDFQQLTQIARSMVGRWGMSDEIGTVTVIPQDGQGPLLPGASGVSEETQRMIDEEVRKIVAGARKDVLVLLRENRDKLDRLAHALLEHETLDQLDAYKAAGIAEPSEPELAAAAV